MPVNVMQSSHEAFSDVVIKSPRHPFDSCHDSGQRGRVGIDRAIPTPIQKPRRKE